MPFYRTLEERSASGRFLAAYEPAAYDSVLAQLKKRINFYRQSKNGDVPDYRRKRLERLETLAEALFKNLQHAANGTIRFPLAKVQTGAEEKSVKVEIYVVFSTITIEERSARGIAIYHFVIAYRKEEKMEYGYLIPRVKN
ncbi:hypothetical protein HYX05_02230 [Candidatus Woesearchaeota archaeon]|nr:hypothetical protein [Candidatus Woesearchaeota archaeon]